MLNPQLKISRENPLLYELLKNIKNKISFGNLTYEASIPLSAMLVKLQERKPYTKISHTHKVLKFSDKILVDRIQKCINRISPSKPKEESRTCDQHGTCKSLA